MMKHAHIVVRSFFIAAFFAALFGVLQGCAGSRTQESTGGYIDDSAITAKVKAALVKDKAVDADDVHVNTFKGKVQLSGFVDSDKQSDEAESDADNVAGVKSVDNELQVKGD